MTTLSAIKKDGLRITRPMYLRDFSDDLEDDFLSVWLNVDLDFKEERAAIVAIASMNKARVNDLRAEIKKTKNPGRLSEITSEIKALESEYNERFVALLARLWSCETSDVLTIKDASDRLYTWCIERSFEMLDNREAEQKKA